MTPNLERALRWAATCHHGQSRKGGNTPYFEHVAGVAMILDRLGFDEDVVIAGLLHDVVEDTEATLADVRDRFGPKVAEIVEFCSEIKLDDHGNKRPWIDRKTDHLDKLANAPINARAVVLADKLHNLVSITCDLNEGLLVWSRFNAERERVIWYYRTSIETLGTGDPRLETLAADCRAALAEVEGFGEPASP
jgi:(p)ppGpp synthase/HD superfamily hydrolase